MIDNTIEQIKSVKLAYIDGIDQGNYDLLSTVFADVVEVDVSESLYDPETKIMHVSIPKAGRCDGKSLAESMTMLANVANTKHTVADPIVTETLDDMISVTWPMTDHVEYLIPNNFAKFEGTGYYHETYVKVNGFWKIASLRLERTHLKLNY